MKTQKLMNHLKKCDKSDGEKVLRLIRGRENFAQTRLLAAREQTERYELGKTVDRLLVDVIATNSLLWYLARYLRE